MSQRRGFYFAITALSLALSFVWGLLLPPFEAPDEQNHYRFMVFLKDHARLPAQLPLPSEVPGEGHQPPLYYALGAAYLKAFDPNAQFVEPPLRSDLRFNHQPRYFVAEEGDPFGRPVHALRIAQLWLQCLSLFCLAVLLEMAVPGPGARLAFAVLALNPGWCFLSGALNNDHLAIALSSLGLLFLSRLALKGGWRSWEAPALGLVLAAGALSKLSVLPLLPLSWACVFFWQKGSERWRSLLWLGGLPLVLAAWWYGRNALVYGDPFGWAMHVITCAGTVHVKSPLNWRWWIFWMDRSFDSSWSVYGWFTWRAPMALTWAYGLGFGLAALGLAKLGLSPQRPFRRLGLVMVGAFSLLLAGVARFNLQFDPPEGRYFYPGLLAVGLALAVGWNFALKKTRAASLLPWSVSFFLVCLNLWLCFGRLIPLYYR